MHAIEFQNIKKSYGNFEALKGLTLSIKKGEFFGLLGPNGAGKTTLMSALVGLVKIQAGKILVFDQDISTHPQETKACIGFTPQEVNVDRFFSIRKTLEFQAGFYGYDRQFAKQRAQEMLERFSLVGKANLPFYKLSGGMQKRLIIARALMSKPKILILDEPSAGIDVELRQELWNYLKDLNRDGTTIILTTHYIDEAEALCERVGIINHGQMVELGTPHDLIDKYCEENAEISLDKQLNEQELLALPKQNEFTIKKNILCLKAYNIGEALSQTLPLLTALGKKIEKIEVSNGNLEEVFLKLIQIEKPLN